MIKAQTQVQLQLQAWVQLLAQIQIQACVWPAGPVRSAGQVCVRLVQGHLRRAGERSRRRGVVASPGQMRTILERRRAVSTERMPWGRFWAAITPARLGRGCAEPSREKGAALFDHGCARLLLGSTLAARPGSSYTLGGAAGRILLLGPCCRRHVLLLPSDDGGGEEGQRMFLNEKPSTLSLNSKLRYTSTYIGGPAFLM